MRRLLSLWLLTALLLAALPAVASSLDDAKAAGHAGEQADGFLGRPPGAPASAAGLIDRINAERAAHYKEIAQKNGTTPTAVGVLAGRKLVDRAPAGEWVRGSDGKWTRK